VNEVQAPPSVAVEGDLTDNLPGGAARARAQAAMRSAPVRSLLGRVVPINTPERHWRRIAQGERRLGRQLRRLPQNWRVLHSVAVCGDLLPISHLVIGPPGVFVVMTTNYRRATVLMDDDCLIVGRSVLTIGPSVRGQATAMQSMLARLPEVGLASVPVVAVVAVDCAELTLGLPTRSVKVLTTKRLRGWLTDQFTRMTPESIEQIYGAVGRVRGDGAAPR
jgi:hypothetical protein